MTEAEALQTLSLAIALVAAVTALVVQLGRLIVIAEHYMDELRQNNAESAQALLDAAVRLAQPAPVALPETPSAQIDARKRPAPPSGV